MLSESQDSPVDSPSPPEATIIVLCVDLSFLSSLGEKSSWVNPLLNFPNEGTLEEEVERVEISFAEFTVPIFSPFSSPVSFLPCTRLPYRRD